MVRPRGRGSRPVKCPMTTKSRAMMKLLSSANGLPATPLSKGPHELSSAFVWSCCFEILCIHPNELEDTQLTGMFLSWVDE